jgi:rubrerythrin
MNNKLFLRMKMLPNHEVTATYVAYQRSEHGNIERGCAAMADDGYEETTFPGRLLPDGREVIEIWGRRWALRADVHAERLAQAMEHARARDASAASARPETAETRSVAGTEGLSVLVCPKCGDALQHSLVCPACAAGKAGYKHRYACVCGGVDLVSRDQL